MATNNPPAIQNASNGPHSSGNTYDAHYKALQKALHNWRDKPGKALIPMTEARLAIAWNYRLALPLQKNDPTTTTYWRWQWPRFESEVKYQELRYTLALYPPKGRLAAQRAVAREEFERLPGHIDANKTLFEYVQSGSTSRDGQLFGWNPTIAQRNAEWLAGFWAFQRYDRYLIWRYTHLSPNHKRGSATTPPLPHQSLSDDTDPYSSFNPDLNQI